jgi:hypothetical protein
MVYGGAGHITRMKQEMREELRKSQETEVVHNKKASEM